MKKVLINICIKLFNQILNCNYLSDINYLKIRTGSIYIYCGSLNARWKKIFTHLAVNIWFLKVLNLTLFTKIISQINKNKEKKIEKIQK